MQNEKSKSNNSSSRDDSPLLPDLPLSPLKLARQISLDKPEAKGKQKNEATSLGEFEKNYFKGFEGDKIINYDNDQFIGLKTNKFEINSIDNEMIYHNVPHFNSNNQGISNILSTNILELLKRNDDEDSDYFANSFIKEYNSIKEYNKVSFGPQDENEYELLEKNNKKYCKCNFRL